MGKLIRNGIDYGGGNGTDIFEVTQAEYDALVLAGTLVHNALYVITDAPNLNATANDLSMGSAPYSSGTVGKAITEKADKTQLTDFIKAKIFTIPVANVTRNMDLSSYVTLDSGYKFLAWQSLITPDGFTADQMIWMSAPNGIQGRPWWHTNPIVGAGTGTNLKFCYFEIKDIS